LAAQSQLLDVFALLEFSESIKLGNYSHLVDFLFLFKENLSGKPTGCFPTLMDGNPSKLIGIE